MKKPKPAPSGPHPRIYASVHAVTQPCEFKAHRSVEQFLMTATTGEHIVAEYAFVGLKKVRYSAVIEDVPESEPAK